jgi:hypothetical protein
MARLRTIAMGALIALLLALGGCGSFMAFAMSCNPMGWSFQTSFVVENAGKEPIRVTPVGVGESSGARHPLPRSYVAVPTVHAAKAGDIEIAPGEAVTIHYDWDDINFSELAVTDASGAWRQITVLPNASSAPCCRQPAVTHIAVPPVAELPEAETDVAIAARAGSIARGYGLYSFYAGPLLLWLGLRLLRRRRESADPPALMAS